MAIKFEDTPLKLEEGDTLIDMAFAACDRNHGHEREFIESLHPDMRAAQAFVRKFLGRFVVRVSIQYDWWTQRGVTIQVHDMTSAEPIVEFLRFLAHEGFPKTGKPDDEGRLGKRTWRLKRQGEDPIGGMWLAVFFPVDNDGGSTDRCRYVRREKILLDRDTGGHRYELVCPDGSMPSGPIGPVVMEGGGTDNEID